MRQLDLFLDTLEEKKLPPSQLEHHTEDIKKSTEALLETRNYVFQYWEYKSYKVSVENEKISKVYFSFWNYKFLVHLDQYSFSSEKLSVHNYYETDPEEREMTLSTQTLKDFKIIWIQKKDSVWYWVFKKNVHYFKFTWVHYAQLKIFLENLLKKYHNI